MERGRGREKPGLNPRTQPLTLNLTICNRLQPKRLPAKPVTRMAPVPCRRPPSPLDSHQIAPGRLPTGLDIETLHSWEFNIWEHTGNGELVQARTIKGPIQPWCGLGCLLCLEEPQCESIWHQDHPRDPKLTIRAA